MSGITFVRRRRHTQGIEQVIFALVLGVLAYVLIGTLLLVGFEVLYAGRIYPGVSIAGVNVGGLDSNAAAALLSQKITFPNTGHIILKDGERTWVVTPAQMGLFLDPQTSARSAYQIGRQGGIISRFSEQLNTFRTSRSLMPAFIFDQRMSFEFLSGIAAQTDIAMVEPSLGITGTEVVVNQGQVGRSLDIPASLALLTVQLQSLRDGVVPLVVSEVRPVIADSKAQADLTRRILSQPFTLSMPPNQPDTLGPWTFEPAQLAEMLNYQRVQNGGETYYQLAVNNQTMGNFLSSLSGKLLRYPQNARFMFNDDTRQLEVIQHAASGRTLDYDATLKAIEEKLLKGEHKAELVFNVSPPTVADDATGDKLGIKELVIAQYSYFYGSSPERVKNITTAAGRFHGLLVAPGETFSMANALGDISLDNGYAEALIISGGRTIQGVGGGVCQVSTTLFRAAFFAGYPINQRFAHAYRVGYYEKEAGNRRNPDLAGMDATVFAPLVDFKFTNDTPNWLLMETYVNPASSSILWKFYSTKDGRSVDWHTTGPGNVVEAPKPLYKENPDLPKGEVKQVDYSADGADITVNRIVTKDGTTYLQDTFSTHYEPWQAIYEYGPGTEGMPPADAQQPIQ